MRTQAESFVSSLRMQFKVQMMKLPAKIKQMPLATFAEKYGGNVHEVMVEGTVFSLAPSCLASFAVLTAIDTCSGVKKMQQDLDVWVAQTPRLRSARKGACCVPYVSFMHVCTPKVDLSCVTR